LLLLVGVHVIWSVARKLCEMSDILAHRHRSFLQILKFLLLKLDNTLGYMMRAESDLELIPIEGVRFFISFYICILPISYKSYQLVRSWCTLSIVALDQLKFLLYRIEPVIGIRGFHRVRESRLLGALKVSKSIPRRRWRCSGLSILHVNHGLLHGLKHLSLHHQNMLQGWWWVGNIVVLSIVVRNIVLGVGVAVPCVNHLKNC
jgi:hypothetical protein